MYMFTVTFLVSGSGDDTRTWGPPFRGSESAYFLSVNRNKKACNVLFTEGGTAIETRVLLIMNNSDLQ